MLCNSEFNPIKILHYINRMQNYPQSIVGVVNIDDSQKQERTLGKISFNTFLLIFMPVMIASPAYTYHMAISNGQQKPFPHTTVTKTACHYPQNIEFRFTMLIAASFMSLLFFVLFRWLEKLAVFHGFRPLGRRHFWLMEGSIGCFCVMIGTMDGEGTGLGHLICSLIFFVNLTAHVIIITSYLNKLHKWSSSALSSQSLLLKKTLSAYIIVIWTYSLYEIAFGPKTAAQIEMLIRGGQLSDIDNPFVDIIEWNTVFVSLLWMLAFLPEWKQINVVLRSPFTQSGEKAECRQAM